MKPSRLAIVVGLVLVVVVATVGVWLTYRGGGGGPDPQTAARTSFTDLEPATEAPSLPSLQTVHPGAGTVVEASGPFDDRFQFRHLTIDDDSVTGTIKVTSDVSDILELETVAGFYDRDGQLVGTGRDIYHLDESTIDPSHEGPPDEDHQFSIRIPEPLRGLAVSAAVGVPILVNE